MSDSYLAIHYVFILTHSFHAGESFLRS